MSIDVLLVNPVFLIQNEAEKDLMNLRSMDTS
jgi:hypothetical protein